MKMKLSVVIVNYNGGGVIADAIRSVLATTTMLTTEVIVVDNGSSDGSGKMLQEQFAKRILFVEMGRNAGFAAANNAGVRHATGEYILFLNPDTIVLDNALQTLVEYMDANPKAGACGANLYSRDMQPQFSYWMLLPGVRMEWSGLWSDYFLKRKYKGSHEHNFTGKTQKVAYIMGADLMVRKSVLESVGMMDEDFFLFYEETELCFRIRNAGYQIVSVPQARIIHQEGSTIDTLGMRREHMMRSRSVYLRKCCSVPERIAADMILAFSCIVRILWFGLSANPNKVSFWKYTLQHIHQI